jgi:peptidoglycan/xylan/chitin deacetylase (PgdA/CDA1 family)
MFGGPRLTILMYHKVKYIPPGARYPGNYVLPEQFEAQLHSLLAWGYHTVTLSDWLMFRSGVGTIPAKPVVLTFDDGCRSFKTDAWPILRAAKCKATVFVVTDRIGGTNAWDAGEVQEPLLTCDEIRELRTEGVEFGSHTCTHRRLSELAPDAVLHELRQSRLALEQLLGEPVAALSYPYNNQSVEVRELARHAGYQVAVRGRGRVNTLRTDVLALRRVKMDTTVSVPRMRRELARLRATQWW